MLPSKGFLRWRELWQSVKRVEMEIEGFLKTFRTLSGDTHENGWQVWPYQHH